jgi:excisionase family DNA binding protein
MPEKRPPRFPTIPEVAKELATSEAQISALVKRGDLPALKLGGRGQWRIERSKLEEFIARAYDETARVLQERGRVVVEPEIDATDLPPAVQRVIDYAPDLDYRQEEGGEA